MDNNNDYRLTVTPHGELVERYPPLQIVVAGHLASGKSRMLYLLKKILREQGFRVIHDLTNDHDFGGNEEQFNRIVRQNFDQVVEHIKDRREIVIREIKLARDANRDGKEL